MKRLGEILLERGAIAISELHTGLEACHHSGGRLGTQLLKFGFVDEHALLEALSEQLGVPAVSSVTLSRAPDALRMIIPPDVARRLQIMVFERKGSSLGIAMTNPRNPATIEEVVSYVGLDITPHIATEAGILSALGRIGATEQTGSSEPNRGYVDPSNAWQKLWTPPPLKPAALIRKRGRQTDGKGTMAAAFPSLSPVPNGSSLTGETALDRDNYHSLLRDVEHRDEIGALLLRRASAVLRRSYLLAVHSGKLIGWLARGPGMVLDDVQSVTAPADSPSVLAKVEAQESFCGLVPTGPVNDLLMEAFGDPPPHEVVILPMMVKNRLVAYFLGDMAGAPIPPGATQELQSAVLKASLSVEILIMKRKILS